MKSSHLHYCGHTIRIILSKYQRNFPSHRCLLPFNLLVVRFGFIYGYRHLFLPAIILGCLKVVCLCGNNTILNSAIAVGQFGLPRKVRLLHGDIAWRVYLQYRKDSVGRTKHKSRIVTVCRVAQHIDISVVLDIMQCLLLNENLRKTGFFAVAARLFSVIETFWQTTNVHRVKTATMTPSNSFFAFIVFLRH